MNNNMKTSPVKNLENQFSNLSLTSCISEDIVEFKEAIRNGMINTRGTNNSIKRNTESVVDNLNTPKEIDIDSSHASISNLTCNDISTHPLDEFIESFMNNDDENLDISDPMNIIDEAYKKTKINNLKDILLDEIKVNIKELIKREIKNEMSNFVEKQNENIDKIMIENFKNEVDFLKKELDKRDKIVEVLLNQSRQACSSQMVISSPQHQCFATQESAISEGTNEKNCNNNVRVEVSDESFDINRLKSNLENQLKSVRLNRHQEFLDKQDTFNSTIIKYSKENSENDTSSVINSTSNLKNIWPSNTCVIVGDSIINGIDEKGLATENVITKVRNYPGDSKECKKSNLIPLIAKKPDYMILHVATNDASNDPKKDIINDLLNLKSMVTNALPNCRLVISKPVIRTDNDKAMSAIRNLNNQLSQLEIECIENDNILQKHVGRKGLHLNKQGTSRLAKIFLHQLRKF